MYKKDWFFPLVITVIPDKIHHWFWFLLGEVYSFVLIAYRFCVLSTQLY